MKRTGNMRSEGQRGQTGAAGPWLWVALAGGIAAIVLLACGITYVNAVVTALGCLTLVGVAQRPHRARAHTVLVLSAIAAGLLWANLRPTQWQTELQQETPAGLDPICREMFWRGWPLRTFMLCEYHHMTFLPKNGFVQRALIYDAAVFVAALLVARLLCERITRWFCARAGRASGRLEPTRLPLVSGPTEGLLAGVLFGLITQALFHVAGWHMGLRTGWVFEWFVKMLNAPAWWLSGYLIHLIYVFAPFANIELAAKVLPFLTSLVQWGFIGLILGIIRNRRLRARGAFGHPPLPPGASSTLDGVPPAGRIRGTHD
jgi:hypothetical protein